MQYLFLLILASALIQQKFALCKYEDTNLRKVEEAVADIFEIENYQKLSTESLLDISNKLQLRETLSSRNLAESAVCGVCLVLIENIKHGVIPLELLVKTVCTMYITMKSYTYTDFCDKMSDLHVPLVNHIFNTSEILDGQLACSLLLKGDTCYFDKPELKWELSVPEKKNYPKPKPDTQYDDKPLKILHLTDFHITTDYEEGSVAKCGYPVCCKKGLGNPFFPRDAGKWGDYRDCDTPMYMFIDTMNYIQHTYKDIDFIYFTGDIIDHTVWNTSVETNSALISFVFESLKTTFPNTKVFPVIGNHESSPLNTYAPRSIRDQQWNQDWLYSLLAKLWSPWLKQDQLQSVEESGYYSYLLNKRLRIIGLHNNVCYNSNWWLLYNTEFLKEQLTWLTNILTEAEKNEEFVHILGHIPPGNNECIEPWENHYSKLIQRFSHIIKAQFFGHTHTDQLKVFFDNTTKEAINIGWNGASLTPYSNNNPNIKIYTVNSSSYEVLDIDTYIFNITEANLTPNQSPRWFKLYNMKEAYGLEDLSPKSIGKLANNLFTDDDLVTQYWRFYVRDGDASLKRGCDDSCKRNLACKAVKTVSRAHVEGC